MVNCEDYNSCFKADSLADMNNCLNGGTHGPVHILVGGEWNDPEQEFIDQTGTDRSSSTLQHRPHDEKSGAKIKF